MRVRVGVEGGACYVDRGPWRVPLVSEPLSGGGGKGAQLRKCGAAAPSDRGVANLCTLLLTTGAAVIPAEHE